MRGSWSTEQLTEFLAAVSSRGSADDAIGVAVERAAEALDAEVGAVVAGGRVAASIGFAAGSVDEPGLLRAASGGRELELAGVGPCAVASAPLEGEDGALLVARSGGDGFGADELHLLRGMARVLAIALAHLRVLDAERAQVAENALLAASLEQQTRLLEQLGRLQRAVSDDVSLQEMFDTIVDGALALMGPGTTAASLRIVDANDPAYMIAVATRGGEGDGGRRYRRAPITEGVSGRAIVTGRLVAVEDSGATEAPSQLAPPGIEAALSVPVREHGRVVGSILVGSSVPGKRWSAAERELLLVFGEHASLLLAAAQTADQMRLAFHDSLTGLPNRALFLDRLEHALHGADDVTVLFIDVDRFKLVNDTIGHLAGDNLLIEVASRLRRCLRPTDTCARLGGDEFAVLLAAGADAEALAERLIAELSASFELEGRVVSVSASVGIATGGEDAETLLRNSDVAMYRAKSAGRGRYARFEPRMHEELVERVEVEADLRRAFERDEFELHFQPILDLRTGSVAALEALLRWRHPERGLVLPLEFVPIAEETGLILALGRWVLEEACRQAALWQRAHGFRAPAVCVNLSGRQVRPELVTEVAEALAGTIDGRMLVIEITETVLMQDAETTSEILGQLKGLGVQIAIDDFGTGYSSLRYLSRFPADILKIAKPFVDALGGDGLNDAALARTIVALGSTLGLATVAEGVEHAAQVRQLGGLGCTFGQGFHFARPLPADEVPAFLAPPAPPAIAA